MRNPFREPMMRKSFDECIAAHRRNSPALQRTSGNSVANAFWRGYDGVWPASKWDAASRSTMEYAQYKAGESCRKEEKKGLT